MIRSTRDLYYHLPCKGLNDARHVLPPVVAMAQPAVVASTWKWTKRMGGLGLIGAAIITIYC
jgi:hypothetical protein